MNRLNANRQIVGLLAALVETYPDMRFTQILANADVLKYDPHSSGIKVIRDEYYLEPAELLERIKKSSLLEVQYDRDDE